MMTTTDKTRALKGLMARLALDANLGAGYAAGAAAIRAALRDLARTDEAAPRPSLQPAPRPSSRPSPQDVRRAAASAAGAGLSAVGAALVPFVPAAVNPAKEALLAESRAACLACRDCELCGKRTTVVWGEGSLDAAVMFVGEGPGRDEDAEGRPFVGRSGRLLTDIIEKGMKIPRNGVYITNIVKCRPPGNRDPKPDEVAACAGYLAQQIAVVAPKVIVAAGSVAGRTLLGLNAGDPGIRGRWWEYQGIPLRVVYHPSYLLRMRRSQGDRTEADRVMWQDVQEVMKKL